MEANIEEDILFCVETTLQLASGDEVTLVKQASEYIEAFSCRDVRIYAGSTFHDKKFSKNAISAYESVFQDFYSNELEETDECALAHEIYNARMHGPWWEVGPSGLKDFAMKNSEQSCISHDFVDFGFPQKVYPVRVSVIELCNPGSIIGIWAKDSNNNKWRLLWSGLPQSLPDEPRVFTPPLRFCNFTTNVLRLELDHSVLDYCALITGVFLIGTSEFLVPNDSFEIRCLGTLLKSLRDKEIHCNDLCNLTPDLPSENLNANLLKFEKVLQENCELHNRKTAMKIPKEKSLRISFTDSTVGRIGFAKDTCKTFDRLSDEIMLKIFKYLDLRSLCSCAQVNNRFKCLTEDALLYTSLNLKPYWNSVDYVALNALSCRCKYLRRLDISWCGSDDAITPEDFNSFLRICGTHLTHLRLYCCDFVDDSVLENISLICTKLKELCLCNSEITDSGFQNLEKFECLERLELYRADIEDPTLCSIIQKNRRMRHLNLSELIMSDLDSVAIVIADSCPNLESIVCWYTSITTVGIRALARCTHLREVDFGYCRGILRRPVGPDPKHSLRTLFTRCNALEKVVLTGMTYLMDEDLEPLLAGPIRQLHVGGAKWLSPEMCSLFFSLCPNLRMIDLNMCYEISDLHVHKWRELYPHVSIKWSSAGTLCSSMFL